MGAVVPRWFPHAGRWLIFVFALLLSVGVIPVSIGLYPEMIKSSFSGSFTVRGMELAWLLSPILLICCIAVVVRDLVTKRRHPLSLSDQHSR